MRAFIFLALFLALSASPATPSRVVLIVGEGVLESFGIDFDRASNTDIVEMGGHRISVLDEAGKLRLLAGTGERGFSGDGGPATKTQFNSPHHLLFGAADLHTESRTGGREAGGTFTNGGMT